MSDRDRDKISFSEQDKQRNERRSGGGKKRGQSQRQSRWASAAYKRKVDEQLFGRKGDAARSRMRDRLLAAQGSPTFLRTYREYVRDYGMPEDLHTLMMLLDLDDERESLKVMEALGATVSSVTPEEKNLLRGRLRNLEMSTSSDALADAAVDLLGRL